MLRTTSLLLSFGTDLVKPWLYQVSYIFIHAVLQAFSLVISSAMLSELRLNTMTTSRFQPRASAFQKAMVPLLLVWRRASFEVGLLKAGADLNQQPESSRRTAATLHDAKRCWCTSSDPWSRERSPTVGSHTKSCDKISKTC
jgi:hypothetical protein